MSKLVTIKDKQFRPYIDEQQIASAVKKLAARINEELRNDFPFFWWCLTVLLCLHQTCSKK